jgi:hypothetical protein
MRPFRVPALADFAWWKLKKEIEPELSPPVFMPPKMA